MSACKHSSLMQSQTKRVILNAIKKFNIDHSDSPVLLQGSLMKRVLSHLYVANLLSEFADGLNSNIILDIINHESKLNLKVERKRKHKLSSERGKKLEYSLDSYDFS